MIFKKLDQKTLKKKEKLLECQNKCQISSNFLRIKIFEELTSKIIEYAIKLTVRISNGIVKGVIKAFRKEVKE